MLGCFILFINVIHVGISQPLKLEWSKGLFSTATSFSTLSPIALELDDKNNTILCGQFQGAVDLDPGVGETVIQGKEEGFGGSNTFIAKYDTDGALAYGYSTPFQIHQVLLIGEEVYIIAKGDTIIDLDLGIGVNEFDARNKPLFVVHYDGNGAFRSVEVLIEDGTNVTMVQRAVFDSNQDLILYGLYRNTVDFDPSVGTKNLSVSGSGNATFVAKYSKDWSLSFAFSIDANNTSTTLGLEVDSKNQFYITGRFGGSGTQFLDLDPGPGNSNLQSIRGVDSYWGKYSSNGTFISAHNLDGSIFQMRFDAEDNMYLIGSTTDSMDVDFTSKTYYIYNRNLNQNAFDLFLAKYDDAQNLLYAKSFDAASNTARVEDVLVSQNQELYMVGEFSDTFGFEKGSMNHAVVSSGARDAFVAKFDASGAVKFSHAYGFDNFEEIKYIRLNKEGELFFTGDFTDSIDLNTNATSSPILRVTGDGGEMFFGKFKDEGALLNLLPSPEENSLLFIKGKYLIVDLTKVEKVNARITVMDVLGKTLLVLDNIQNRYLEIPLESLPQGQVFFTQMENNGRVLYKKMYLD